MSDDRLYILLEHMNDKLQVVAEAVSVLAQDMREVKQILVPVPQMAADPAAIKLASIDHSTQLGKHDQRITMLEMPGRA